jgi:hypothetical protein
MNRIVRAVALVALSAVVAMAGGCATTSTKRGQAVEDRASKRWELLIAGKADEAYEILTAGYRSTHPKDVYVAAKTHTAITWKAAKYVDKQCESEEVCTVRILLTYSLSMHAGMPKPVEASTYESEKWIKSGGQWFHLPHE